MIISTVTAAAKRVWLLDKDISVEGLLPGIDNKKRGETALTHLPEPLLASHRKESAASSIEGDKRSARLRVNTATSFFNIATFRIMNKNFFLYSDAKLC